MTPAPVRDPLDAEGFEDEVRDAVRYERRLALKALLVVLLVVALVYVRQRWLL